MSSKPSVLVLGSPFPHSSREYFIKKLTRILNEVCETVHIIGANEPHQSESVVWERVEVPKEASQKYRYYKFLTCQLKSIRYSFDVAFDFIIIRITPYVLPAVWLRLAGRSFGTIVTQRTDSRLNNLLSTTTMNVSDNLIVEAGSVLEQWGENYDHKSIVGPTYVDQSRFDVRVPYAERDPTVGFLGVLNERKGVPALIESILMVSEKRQDLAYKIGGDGPLAETVSKTANELDCLEYLGYVPNDDLVNFYNSLELFILPTESEGLPNVALEAMACGTPVLATAVGGLPDLIDDGESGFLMEDNAPDTIKLNISRALDSDLQSVSDRARETVRETYTFEDAVRRYERIVTQ